MGSSVKMLSLFVIAIGEMGVILQQWKCFRAMI